MLGTLSTLKQSENMHKGDKMTMKQKILEAIGCFLFMFSIISLASVAQGVEQTVIEMKGE